MAVSNVREADAGFAVHDVRLVQDAEPAGHRGIRKAPSLL